MDLLECAVGACSHKRHPLFVGDVLEASASVIPELYTELSFSNAYLLEWMKWQGKSICPFQQIALHFLVGLYSMDFLHGAVLERATARLYSLENGYRSVAIARLGEFIEDGSVQISVGTFYDSYVWAQADFRDDGIAQLLKYRSELFSSGSPSYMLQVSNQIYRILGSENQPAYHGLPDANDRYRFLFIRGVDPFTF